MRRASNRIGLLTIMMIGMLVTRAALADSSAGTNRQHFELTEGPAADRLMTFAQQARLSVLFDYDCVNQHDARAVSGDLAAVEALTRMLKGTGLEFVFSTAHTISVMPRQRCIKASSAQQLPAKPPNSNDIEEVRIIAPGTYGDVTAMAGTQVDTVSSEQIERAGFTTTADWLHTLPQVFGGGATDDTHIGREAETNTAYGNGVNLRGLGSRATLVLVNGHRLAPSGSAGAFTDIANIPITAVDHIEVVADGAGVLYGADGVGGIMNFVLRGDRPGSTTQATLGGLTKGSLREQLFSHSFATQWDTGNGLLSLEYYERDALPASARLQATSDLRSFGGSNFDDLSSNPGTIVDSRGQLWAIPTGQNGYFLRPSDLIPGSENLHDQYSGTWILPHQRRLNALLTGEQRLNDVLTVFVDALVGRREVESRVKGLTAALMVPASNPFYVNPIAGDSSPVEVLYGLYKDLGPVESHGRIDTGQYVLGFNWEADSRWNIRAHVGYASSDEEQVSSNLVNFPALQQVLADPDPMTAFNPFGDGSNTNPATLAAIRTQGRLWSGSTVRYANVSATGLPIRLPAGPVKLIAGADGRIQTLSSFANPQYLTATPATRRGRTVTSLFATGELPILTPDPAQGRSTRVVVSAGLREEIYSDVGRALAPQIGFRFSPWNGIALQGSWAGMFVAPNLADLSESSNISELLTLYDPHSLSGHTTALVWAGNNGRLALETANSLNLQLTFAPDAVPDLSAALTYFNMTFSNQIYRTNLAADVLADPRQSWLVTRNVTTEQRSQVCNDSTFLGGAMECLNTPIGAIVDMRLRNMETLKTDGFDLTSEYRPESAIGHLTVGLAATYVLRYAQAYAPNDPIVDVRNTPHNPPGLRFVGSLGWQRRGLLASFGANYQSGYRDVTTLPNRPVDSWVTFDTLLSLTWRMSLAGSIETQVFIRGQNIFNSNPPFVNDSLYGIGYDPENGDLLGRRVSLNIRMKL